MSGSAASRAAGFGLLYRERVNRILTGLNRLTMVGDSLGAINIGHLRLQRDGQRWEVLAGPNDNNAIGRPIYQAAWAWRGLGGRALELTLLRQLEGLVFVEAVSGHPGLTNRMALPGWTRTMDGLGLQVLRLRAGSPVASPAAPDPALEREVLETFFGGVQVTFHEDPAEFYFSRHPVGRLEEWALTFVFEELPDWLRISDCCASFLATPAGPWAGAWWSNHNSRDNFSDLALGYLTAFDLADEPGLSAELRAAAQRAAAAGRRVGDHIVAAGNVLLTVSEHGP